MKGPRPPTLHAEGPHLSRRPRARLHHTKTERTCYLCRRVLVNAEFTRRSNGTFFSACKDCNRHVFAQRRRARLAGAGGSYTMGEWTALLTTFDHCPDCGREWDQIPAAPGGYVITADHIVPISQGGRNDIGQRCRWDCRGDPGG